MNTDYSKGFFGATFQYLRETGLPYAEVWLLEDAQDGLPPETFARAMVHAYERALAIQRGMLVIDDGLNRGAFHLYADSTCVWFVPQSQGKGPECPDATYGSTDCAARMAYVLTFMTLPIPMDDWLREYS